MLELLGVLVGLCLPVAVAYYFMLGGKEKLSEYLFNKISLEGKVEKIIKKDLSPKYARAAFYIGNNYRHKITQTEWQKYCQERVDNTLDKNTQEYAEAVAPIVNAVVVGEDGYYLRRGMEYLDRSLEKFLPGVNDSISLNYFVEPYEYFKNEELAAKSLAAEQLRQKKYKEEREKNAPSWQEREAARARCRKCAHYSKCDWRVRERTIGSCGGYTPR